MAIRIITRLTEEEYVERIKKYKKDGWVMQEFSVNFALTNPNEPPFIHIAKEGYPVVDPLVIAHSEYEAWIIAVDFKLIDEWWLFYTSDDQYAYEENVDKNGNLVQIK